MTRDKQSPEENDKPISSKGSALRVPIQEVLVGLGVMAATSSVQAGPAQDDAYSMQPNTTLSGVNVTANDNPQGSYWVVLPPAAAQHGSASIDSPGVLTYTPNPGFVGSDSFSYTLHEGNTVTTAQVNIMVAPVSVPTLAPAALGGLAGLLAFFGIRRRRNG